MRFRLVALLAILLTFGFTAKATDVTITQVDLATNSVSAKIPNFNVSNLGNAITISSVTVTNGTYATLTCSACFRPSWVGLGGFTIKVGTDLYTVRNVDTTSQVTLTKGCTQPTPSTVIWYPYVEFRIYSDRAFQPLGANYIVQPGTPGTGSWYKRYAASILDVNSVKTLYLPEMTIDATTDAVGPTNQARYMAGFYRPDNSFVQFYACFEQFRVPTTTPTTWTALCAYNSPPAIVPPANEAYTKTQIDARFPSCTTGQMIYYATTGQIQTCLTVGSGLTISGGSISTTGSAGTVTSVALSLPNIFTVSGSPVTTTGTLTGTLATQNNRLVFAGPIGFPYPTGSTGVAAAPTFRALNFYDQAQTRAALNVITDFYCSGDGTTTTTGNMSSGTDTLTVASASTWRVGEGIRVMGAGVAGQPLDATVSAISGTTFTLDVLASTTVVGAVVYHNDTACIDLAILNAQAAGYFGKIVYLPAGTYNIYGTLSVPGGVTLEGDGHNKTIIYSQYAGVVLDAVQGTGAYAYQGPIIRHLRVLGNGSSNQIGIRVDDVSYVYGVEISNVDITGTGSHGIYLGNVFSSRFVNINTGSSTSGYPFYMYSANMPGNYFASLYAGDVNVTSPAGFRIRRGSFVCIECNGINSSDTNSWWAIVGDKSGVDGSVAGQAAYLHCIDCNIESSKAGGVLLYSNSAVDLDGNTTIQGDGGSSGTYIGLKYELDLALSPYPPFNAPGKIGPRVTFTQSPLAYYANNEPIHATDLPPLLVEGAGPQVAGQAWFGDSFYNTTTTRSEKLMRADALAPTTTITTSTTINNPGPRYFETNCGSNCTLTIPWASWYKHGEYIVIRNLSADGITVTIASGGGGSVNGGTLAITKQGQSYTLYANPVASDWRIVGTRAYLPNTYVGVGDANANLSGSSGLTWDTTTLTATKAGSNPSVQVVDSTNSITTRFGPLAGAPDRGIVGTTTNHPFVIYQNGGEAWGVDVSKNLIPYATTNTLDLGGASNRVKDGYFGGGINFAERATPSTPAANSVYLYAKDKTAVSTLYYMKDDGTEVEIGAGGTPSLTATYVGYGDGSNLLTGSSRLTWDNSTYKLSLSNNATLGLLLQAGGGTTAAHPGSAYGLIMPYVGGGQATAGPGIFWTDGTYTSMVGLWLNLGLNFQGTGGVNNFKIRKATDAGSDGDIVFDLRPNDGRFDLYPYGASAGNTTQIAFRELAANGTNYVAFKAADSLAGDVTWTLPSADSSGSQCLSSNGSGTLSWVACSGSGTPGGSNKQVQFNNSSAFGGAAGFEYQAGASPNVSITAQNAAYVPLYVNGASSQTANLQQWAVNSTIFNVITKDGYLYLGRGETSATPSGGRIYATGGSGTNIAGASLVLYGGAGTGSGAGGSIAFYTAAAGGSGSTPNTPVIQYELDQLGNHFFGNAQLAQAATDGFVHIPGIANVPSGVPTLITGLVPLAVDETNYRLYGYSGGAWRNLTGAASGLTIGTTAITSGTAGRILYETSGNVVGEIAGSSADANGAVQFAATARSSGVAQYFRINTPADTGITADTESVGVYFGGNGSGSTVTRTLADGTTLALQRENVFVAPTYAAAGATTITTAATLAITGAPIVGASTTITNSTAMLIQQGGDTTSSMLRLQHGHLAAGANTNVPFGIYDSAGTLKLGTRFVTGPGIWYWTAPVSSGRVGYEIGTVGGGSGLGTSDGTNPTIYSQTAALVWFNGSNGWTVFNQGYQVAFGSSVSSYDLGLFRAAAGILRITNASTGAGKLIIGTSSASTTAADLYVVGSSASLTPLRVDSAASPSVDIVSFTNNASQRWGLNSSTTSTNATVTDVNGGTQVRGTLTESITLNTGGTTTDSTIDLPANSIILSVTARVTTTITTATAWRVGDATVDDRFTSDNSTLTAGTTDVGINQWKADRTTAGQGAFQQSTAKVRVTTTGTPGAGAIRITIHYITLSAPTS